jgi:glycerol uptake facilitator-like aquaporin
MKKYIAESVGTFFLAFVVYVSIASGWSAVATPLLAALTLGLCVYTLGHVSGTHINPAVTIGLWSIGKIKSQDALLYIIAQFVGAVAAMLLASMAFGLSTGVLAAADLTTTFAELLGAMFFAFGIASAVYGRSVSAASGFVVGGSLLIGVAIAADRLLNRMQKSVMLGLSNRILIWMGKDTLGGEIPAGTAVKARWIEEIVFSGPLVLLAAASWAAGALGFPNASLAFQGLLALTYLLWSGFAFGFSHERMYVWEGGKIVDKGPLSTTQKLKLSFLGMGFRIGFLLELVAPGLGLLVGFLLANLPHYHQIFPFKEKTITDRTG